MPCGLGKICQIPCPMQRHGGHNQKRHMISVQEETEKRRKPDPTDLLSTSCSTKAKIALGKKKKVMSGSLI